MSREVMQMALDALDALEAHADFGIKADKALTALREALAQPKQEPVAWDIYEYRNYGAPGQKAHRVLWVEHYKHEDGSTPDLDWMLALANKSGGIDGGAQTIHAKPMYYAAPPAVQTKQDRCATLAALGWQAVECPSCGSLARGYPRSAQPAKPLTA